MFEVKGNKVLEAQIRAATAEALDIQKEEVSPIARANMLRQIVQMKERAARFVIYQLEDVITRFSKYGVSSVSLVAIAEAYQQAVEAATSQMQIFANELAGLTNSADIAEGYIIISERLTTHVEALIKPLKENKEKALSDIDSLVFAEIYETWHALENKPT